MSPVYGIKRKGQSTKPCHGCGSTSPHWSDRVCDNCAKAIKSFNEIEAQRKAAPDTAVMWGKEREYALPYLPHVRHASPEPIAAGFLQLQRALSTPADYQSAMENIFNFSRPVDSSRQHEWRCAVRIRKDHAAVLGSTYEAVSTALDRAYAEGHAAGRNLLSSLASGRITPDEFNNAAARLDG